MSILNLNKQLTVENMIGTIRRDYIVICPIETSEEFVDAISQDIGDTILKEEQLKELGFSIDELTEGSF